MQIGKKESSETWKGCGPVALEAHQEGEAVTANSLTYRLLFVVFPHLNENFQRAEIFVFFPPTDLPQKSATAPGT